MKTKNIIISGTNFWNPGDDFVRDGVIKILRTIFPGYFLNFHFYNFNQDFYPQSKFSGIHNMVAKGDLEKYRDYVDHIVIAGLSAGSEIKDLYNWIIDNSLQDRVYLIGAGYENNYVDQHIYQEPELTIFKNAKVITGRTKKTPAIIKNLNLPYHHINCPAILSVDKVKELSPEKKIEKIAFSVQLPHGYGVSNHMCSESMYRLSLEIFSELAGKYEIDFIAHHKTEYFHFLNIFKKNNIPANVIFSSFYKDLYNVYPEYDLVITTRLHSSLFANGFGIPGLIINDTDRHTHCLEGFQHSHWINSIERFREEFEKIKSTPLKTIAEDLRQFKKDLLNKYVNALAAPFNQEQSVTGAEIINYIKENAAGIDVKKRVLSIFSKLEKDYWLERNILNYENMIGKNLDSSFDMASFQNWYAHEFKPLKYLEIGVRRGRSMAQVLNESPGTSITGVDLWLKDYSSDESKGIYTTNPGPEFVLEELSKFNKPNRPKLIKGNSLEVLPEFFSSKLNDQLFDLILVDGDHSYEGANKDLAICFEHLADGGVLVFDDINHPTLPDLYRLWKEYEEKLTARGYIFLEDMSGTGTGIAVKPPFTKFINKLINRKKCVQDKKGEELPIHFFTIVLNGEPFIEYHAKVFKNLPFKWHWHIIEGVADFINDSAWCLRNGGVINEELHRNGLSNDGTAEYLDSLASSFPENITVYRKGNNEYWNGKCEMVNAPLKNVNEECLLWEIDVDELWSLEQIIKARDIFINNPEKTAAYYRCHYFVGEDLVISSKDTYGNYSYLEWLRTWRYRPGDSWVSHEPPKLCRFIKDEWKDIAQINPFLHAETSGNGLTFQHYAYALEKQLRFKELYYGYKDAVEQWKRLQRVRKFPVMLKEYFNWVSDNAVVEHIDSLKINPYLEVKSKNKFSFDNKRNNNWKRIVFLRSDSIGDNVLASSLLYPLKEQYPDAHFTVVCQSHIAELYESIPFIDEIITFDNKRILTDEIYKKNFVDELSRINADVVLNTIFSRTSFIDLLVRSINAEEKIGFEGDTHLIMLEEWEKNNKYYTQLITIPENYSLEIDREKEFLKAIGIRRSSMIPKVWITNDDEEFAERFFIENRLDPSKTIALFAGVQYWIRIFENYGKALSDICLAEGFSVISLGDKESFELNQRNLDQIKTLSFNLSGKLTLRQSAALIKRCRLAVGAETSLAHIACAVGTPNVILLGGGHFGKFMPYSNLTTIACLPLDCYGCNWFCKYEKNHCVKDIDTGVLSKAIKDTLETRSEKPRVFVQKQFDGEKKGSLPKWKMFDNYLNTGSVEITYVDSDIKENTDTLIISEAENDISTGNLISAKEKLLKVLKETPANLLALNDLVVVCILEKNFDEAGSLLSIILELDPGNETAKENMQVLEIKRLLSNAVIEAEKLIESEDLHNAKTVLLRVLEIEPDNLDALNNLSVIHYLENNIAEALSIINRVLELNPGDETAVYNKNILETYISK